MYLVRMRKARGGGVISFACEGAYDAISAIYARALNDAYTSEGVCVRPFVRACVIKNGVRIKNYKFNTRGEIIEM